MLLKIVPFALFSSPLSVQALQSRSTDSQLAVLVIPSRQGPRRKHRSSLLKFSRFRGNMFVCKPLLRNDTCIFAYLAVVAQQRVYMLQYCELYRCYTIICYIYLTDKRNDGQLNKKNYCQDEL
jgi:hypothetical protein